MIVNNLAENPKNGGRPPNDKISDINKILLVGLILNLLISVILEEEYLLKNNTIGMVEILYTIKYSIQNTVEMDEIKIIQPEWAMEE